ncbi:MAG: isoprenylcysteine carboxylmethyltransferase family protein [Ktedonobacterales bacterium]
MARLYTVAFAIALVIRIIPASIGSIWQRSSRDPAALQEDRGSYLLLNVAIVVGLVVGFGLAAVWTGAAIAWFRPQVTIAGIVLIVLGAALRWWAIAVLGRYFTRDVAVRSTQSVVESGP